MSNSEKPLFLKSLLQKFKKSVHVSSTEAGIDTDFVFIGDVPTDEWQAYFKNWQPEHRKAFKKEVDEACKRTPDDRQEYVEGLASETLLLAIGDNASEWARLSQEVRQITITINSLSQHNLENIQEALNILGE